MQAHFLQEPVKLGGARLDRLEVHLDRVVVGGGNGAAGVVLHCQQHISAVGIQNAAHFDDLLRATMPWSYTSFRLSREAARPYQASAHATRKTVIAKEAQSQRRWEIESWGIVVSSKVLEYKYSMIHPAMA